MKPTFIIAGLLVFHGFVFGQGREGLSLPGPEIDIPFLSPAEKKTVEEQRAEFSKAVEPVLGEASKSTVRVWGRVGRRGDMRLAYGTVIGDGTKILTKWSEVRTAEEDFRIEASDRSVRAVTLTGVYPDDDLAVLTIEGSPLVPVNFSTHSPQLGEFLIASQPDGRPAGFGVVSVLERNLKNDNKPYLGVAADLKHSGRGVKVQEVMEESGAEAAGLRAGDLILEVGGRETSDRIQLQNSLWGAKPGDTLEVKVLRGDREEILRIVLGVKPELQQFRGGRLLQMERMGSRLSRVRDGFSLAIETDMVLEPAQAGGPVANLRGEVVGISLSRAGRTRSYVMPGRMVDQILAAEPMEPVAAAMSQQEQRELRNQAFQAREAPPRARVVPMDEDEFEKMKRHQGDATKLSERIRSELEALEKGE